jgi:hypothetical protein
MNKSCKDCEFFEEDNGFCRRFPPKPVVLKKKLQNKFVVESMFPIISKPEKDWCGEHKPKNSLLAE